MRIWFDTEFIEDGRTIDLISIGMVREDDSWLYLENRDCDFSRASDWVRENVLPKLAGGIVRVGRAEIAESVRAFVGEQPEFWAYYADYDWVALCQLYGTMMELPKGWPMFCRDIKQEAARLGDPELPPTDPNEHYALSDAQWNKRAWEFLQARGPSDYARGVKDERERCAKAIQAHVNKHTKPKMTRDRTVDIISTIKREPRRMDPWNPISAAAKNPKHAAGLVKQPYRHIPPSAIAAEGRVMAKGAAKYGDFNWGEAGVVAGVYYEAIKRHLEAWWTGEDNDPETGESHLAHIRAGAGILIDCMALGNMEDTRPIGKTAPVGHGQ